MNSEFHIHTTSYLVLWSYGKLYFVFQLLVEEPDGFLEKAPTTGP